MHLEFDKKKKGKLPKIKIDTRKIVQASQITNGKASYEYLHIKGICNQNNYIAVNLRQRAKRDPMDRVNAHC